MSYMICAFCWRPAEFTCNCVANANNMCQNHIAIHLRLKGNHYIKQVGPAKISFNPIMKAKLLSKINSLKFQAKLDIKSTIVKSKDIIKKISGELNILIRYMKGLIISFDDTINYITSLNDEIEEKEFYIPLESLLIMQEPKILDQIYGPKINFYSFDEKIIKYKVSNFPECLLKYCFKAVDFSKESVINYNDGIKENQIKTNLHWKGRLLNVGKNLVFFTGGNPASVNVYLINLESQKILPLPPMLQKRHCHSMAWIDGFPAVMGGLNDEEYLSNVEIYKNGSWKRYPPMISKRRSFGSITYFSKVYVFGGNNGGEYFLNSIEKYENDSWRILHIKLFSPVCFPGIFVSGIYILIFGGFDKKKNNSKACSILDLRTNKFIKSNFKQNEPLYYTNLNFLTLNGELYGHRNDSNDSTKFGKLDLII